MQHLKQILYLVGFLAFMYVTIVHVPVWLTSGQPMWFVAIAWLAGGIYAAISYLASLFNNLSNKENKSNESE